MKIQRGQKGAAAIEFAIIFPIFFLIFYAVVTYGLIFAAQQTITLAASEGLYAVLCGTARLHFAEAGVNG